MTDNNSDKSKEYLNPNINDEAMDFETSKSVMLAKSERRAWFVASGAVAIAICLGIALASVFPLKKTEPFLVRVDNATGVTDIVSLMKEQVVDYNDIQDKYWIGNFIRAREGYNWYTLQKDYDLVALLASRPVAIEYAKLFQGAAALDETWKNKYKAEVKILTISPNGNGAASIRFIKNTTIVETGQEHQKPSYWIATINYQYRATDKIKESERLVNPFGFTVISYRVDPEMGVAQ